MAGGPKTDKIPNHEYCKKQQRNFLFDASISYRAARGSVCLNKAPRGECQKLETLGLSSPHSHQPWQHLSEIISQDELKALQLVFRHESEISEEKK